MKKPNKKTDKLYGIIGMGIILILEFLCFLHYCGVM